MKDISSVALTEPAEDPGEEELTPRQLEILSLLTAGKANKEIAYELGIGLGTVKQHVVALFRKLNVTNRAMAVSRGLEMTRAAAPGAPPAPLDASDSVELRPVTVLSLGCSRADDSDADRETWQRLQSAAMAAVQSVDSVLIGRPGRGIDVIFGLHKVDERDADHAVTMARAVYAHFTAGQEGTGPHLPRMRAAVVSGYLLASIGRCGGWTGETVAGRLIAHARTVRDSATANGLCIDASAQRLLAFASRATQPRPAGPLARPVVRALAGHNPGPPGPPPASPPFALVGRVPERTALQTRITALAQGLGGVVWIEGEAGMGKTTLARTTVELTSGFADWNEHCCGVPEQALLADRIPILMQRLQQRPQVVMVDDIHAADEAETRLLQHLAALTAEAPLLLLGVGRRLETPALATAPGARLRLGRMATAEIRTLILDVAGGRLPTATLTHAVELAAGVPLFAYELGWEARFGQKFDAIGEPIHLPLPLVSLVMSRLDALALDHAVLKTVAWHEPVFAEVVALETGDPPKAVTAELGRAVAAGVMKVEPEEDGPRFRISHPLIAAVLRLLMPVATMTPARMKG